MTDYDPAASAANQVLGAGFSVAYLAVAILLIASMWRIFTKAGRPGWAAIVPFYNVYVMLDVVGRPGWWLLLYFVPVVNFVVSIIVLADLAKVFGKGIEYVLGLIILPFVFYPMLAFGSAVYVGPGGYQPPGGQIAA